MEFDAWIRVRNKRKFRALRIVVFVICIIMILCMLLKLMVGDFDPSDLRAMITSLLVMFVAAGNGKNLTQYVEERGTVRFDNEGIVVTQEANESDKVEYANMTRLQWFEPNRRLLIHVRHAKIVNILVDAYDNADEIKEKLQAVTSLPIENEEMKD